MIVAAIAPRHCSAPARDLDRMLAATRRVEDGDYAVRIGKTSSDLPPIQELARGFDTMAARLEADEEQRRTLLADVSHELRTPLAVITGNLEAILDGVYPADAAHLAPILDETRVLERLIDDLRTVALSEAGTLPLHPEPTDPDLLIADVARSFRPAAEAGRGRRSRPRSRTTCRSSTSIRCGSARSSPTSSRTRSATRRRAAA